MRRVLPVIALVVLVALVPADPPSPPTTSWPMFGGTPARNMVNLTTALLSHEFPIAKEEDRTFHVLGNRVKWKATLGSRSYTQPIVVGDRVLIGTNNANPRNKRDRNKPTDDDPDG